MTAFRGVGSKLNFEPHIKTYLSISLDMIIVLAPNLPCFKGLGMRNLQYWIRICQKSHNKVTNRNYILSVVRIFMKQTLSYIVVKSNFSFVFFWRIEDAISKKSFWNELTFNKSNFSCLPMKFYGWSTFKRI